MLTIAEALGIQAVKALPATTLTGLGGQRPWLTGVGVCISVQGKSFEGQSTACFSVNPRVNVVILPWAGVRCWAEPSINKFAHATLSPFIMTRRRGPKIPPSLIGFVIQP